MPILWNSANKDQSHRNVKALLQQPSPRRQDSSGLFSDTKRWYPTPLCLPSITWLWYWYMWLCLPGGHSHGCYHFSSVNSKFRSFDSHRAWFLNLVEWRDYIVFGLSIVLQVTLFHKSSQMSKRMQTDPELSDSASYSTAWLAQSPEIAHHHDHHHDPPLLRFCFILHWTESTAVWDLLSFCALRSKLYNCV